METLKKFSKATTIHVTVPSNMTLEQTNAVTAEIMRLAGCPHCYSGFKINFGDEVELVAARIAENNEIRVASVN